MEFCLPLPHSLELAATMQSWEPEVTGTDQTRVMKRADELGYDMLLVPEHFIIPKEHVELSGAHYFHTYAAQGYIAGATSRIKVGTSLTILPLQHAVIAAKALSTIDWMSGGRIIAAFGVGWLKDEFDIMGLPFNKRGRMTDEYLEAMIELWTKEWPEYEGEFVSFKDVAFAPKCVQKPHVPIWIGGYSDAALRRTARFATGWLPYLVDPEDFPAKLDFIKSQPAYHGQPMDVMFSLSTLKIGDEHVVIDDPRAEVSETKNAQVLIDNLAWLKELGVTVTNAPIPTVKDLDAYLDYAQWIIEEVKPKL